MIEALMFKLCFTMEQLDQWKKQLPEYSNIHVIFAEYDDEESDEICLFVQIEEWGGLLAAKSRSAFGAAPSSCPDSLTAFARNRGLIAISVLIKGVSRRSAF